VTVLKRGFKVKGRVIDSEGKPITGAKVSGGDSWSQDPRPAKSDARGEFVLEGFPPGASLVTVMAEGFAPDLREIHPEDQPVLGFRLEPGHSLRGKVVDVRGKPVPGAMVAAETWREHRSLDFRVDTGNDGRFAWRSAPGDAVIYAVGKTGFMFRRRQVLTPSDEEQIVTLDPELVISGRVTDASTGRPVPTFRVVQGLMFSNNPRMSWMVQDAVEFTDGRYTIKHSEAYAGYAVRVEAAGFKPAESRVFKPTEGATSFDFALSHAGAEDLLTGVVLLPDGRPAAGAEVALATPDHPLLFESEFCRFGRGNGMSFVKTDSEGRFSFNLPGGPYRLAVMSDYGFAESTPEEHEKSETLTLEAWGKIKGEARIGREPAANQPISVSRRNERPTPPGEVHAFYNLETRTDAQGRFVFERVIPGATEVARVVVTEFGNGMQQHMGCWQEPLDVAPGQTVEIRIGGKGRQVVGRIALKAPPRVHVDWRQNRPVTIAKVQPRELIPGFFGQDLRQNDRFAASVDKNGRFQVEDVPPGHYELNVTIDAPPAADRPGPIRELGRLRLPVNVPEGKDSEPVDLGEIAAEVKGQ
jgi:protocatechuate 3,4-dioxygenase beta subunit